MFHRQNDLFIPEHVLTVFGMIRQAVLGCNVIDLRRLHTPESVNTGMYNDRTKPAFKRVRWVRGLVKIAQMNVLKKFKKTIIGQYVGLLFVFGIPETYAIGIAVQQPVQFLLALPVVLLTTVNNAKYVLIT